MQPVPRQGAQASHRRHGTEGDSLAVAPAFLSRAAPVLRLLHVPPLCFMCFCTCLQCYVRVPPAGEMTLSPLHCQIVPLEHCSNTRSLDDGAFEEIEVCV